MTVWIAPLTAARRLARRMESERALRRHRTRLGSVTSDYIDAQLRRTLVKRDQPLQPRTRFLVARLAEHVPLHGAAVLCVGCRNVRELDHLRDMGAARAVGLDLFSEHPAIVVGDMHCMGFATDAFDVVYASHSLEHAHHPDQVISEYARVLRPGGAVLVEVPVRYPTSDADLVDFGDVEGLAVAFAPFGATILWQDEQEPRTETNVEGSPVARLIARLGDRTGA